MSGRRRRRHAGNTATAEGIRHQGGGGSGEGGSSGQPLVSVGGGGVGRDVRTSASAMPEDGPHLSVEGSGLPGAAAMGIDGQARAAARTAEERQSQPAADGSGRDGADEGKGDQDLVSRKGGRFLNEEAALRLQPLQPCTLAEKKESQVAADDGGKEGDQVMNSWKGGCFLLHAVMKWRVEDVLNADLFKEKVQKIPSTFCSVQKYLHIHTYHLLEETRANIHTGLSDLAEGQTYHALSVSPTATPYVYFIDIDLKKASACSHIAKDGDLFFLDTQPHGELGHTSGCFAIAIEVGRYSCFQKGFQVLVSKYSKDVNFQAIKHVSFLTNIMGGITLSKAITSVDRGGSAAVESILRIDAKEICSCGELALDDFSPPNKFNDKQINALKCILSKLRCQHNNVPEVLWGPL